MIDFLPYRNSCADGRNGRELPGIVPVASDGVGNQVVAPNADGYQVCLNALIRNVPIAARPMVDLQPVTGTVFVTQAAAVAIKDEASIPLDSPQCGSDVLIVGHGSAFAPPILASEPQIPAYLAVRRLANGRARVAKYAGICALVTKTQAPTVSGLIIAHPPAKSKHRRLG